MERLNKRLERPIEPFKLLRRQDMIQRLIYDAKVVEAVAEHAQKTGVREDVAFEQARRYAREIVPSFSATAYFGIAIRLARLLSRAFYRVRLWYFDEMAIKNIDPDATVIFIMNHRSNMDYVLVTYLAAEHSALSYAVGEWARVWPLSRLIKAMGAYFIRRRSRNDLYRRVLARYVQMATAAGVAQAVFPEGGLSLDGAVGAPKLGLLNYIVSDFDPASGRDVVFVPVALNYDRVLEDRMLVAAGISGERGFKFRISTAFRYFFKHIYQRLTGRFLRYGYAAVSYGTPLSLNTFASGKSGDVTKALGRELMARVRDIVPILPIPLMCHVVLQSERGIQRGELIQAVSQQLVNLSKVGPHIRPFEGDAQEEATAALNHLLVRHMVIDGPNGIVFNPADQELVKYYASSVSHQLC